MAATNNYIPEKIYKSLLEYAPRVCVDLVIVNGKRFLLGKRKIEPAKGRWIFVGGRILKNESKENAVRRKLKEELGINPPKLYSKLLGVGETFFKNQEIKQHDIIIVFLVKIKEKEFKNFDKNQHSQLAWFYKINPNWHPHVKNMLKTAGFK